MNNPSTVIFHVGNLRSIAICLAHDTTRNNESRQWALHAAQDDQTLREFMTKKDAMCWSCCCCRWSINWTAKRSQTAYEHAKSTSCKALMVRHLILYKTSIVKCQTHLKTIFLVLNHYNYEHEVLTMGTLNYLWSHVGPLFHCSSCVSCPCQVLTYAHNFAQDE